MSSNCFLSSLSSNIFATFKIIQSYFSFIFQDLGINKTKIQIISNQLEQKKNKKVEGGSNLPINKKLTHFPASLSCTSLEIIISLQNYKFIRSNPHPPLNSILSITTSSSSTIQFPVPRSANQMRANPHIIFITTAKQNHINTQFDSHYE